MDVETLKYRGSKVLFDLDAIMQTARREDRGFTDAERTQCDTLEKSLDEITTQIKRVGAAASFDKALADIIGGARPATRDGRSSSPGAHLKNFGQQFVESDAFKWFSDPAERTRRSGAWTSPAYEIERWALTEDPASGGALVPPDVQPGITSAPVLPTTVADLFAPGVTASNSVAIMVEKTFVNAAAPTLEGGVKPESSITFELRNEPVRKIAHHIVVSEELLDDQPAARSYIDTRMRYGVDRVTDYQLLFGSGIAPQLEGLLVRPGLAPDVVRTDPETNSDAILRAISSVEATTGLAVSGVILNPAAWASIIGSKTVNGEYIAGGPFGTQTAPMIWNRPVALTDQVPATEGVVGAFKTGAQVFRRGGIRGDMTNSHQDHFTRNLIAIRWELRLSLAVYRSAAFAKVTTLTT